MNRRCRQAYSQPATMSFSLVQPLDIIAPWLIGIAGYTDHYHAFPEDLPVPSTIKEVIRTLLDTRTSRRYYCLECGTDMGPYSMTRQLCGKRYCEYSILS